MRVARKLVKLIALIAIASITFVLGVFNLATGHDKIANYYNSENYSSLNENAYVGGDAYNYIINGTYFTGYAVKGMGYLIISTICGVSALYLFISKEGGVSRKDKTDVPSICDVNNNGTSSEGLASNGGELMAWEKGSL